MSSPNWSVYRDSLLEKKKKNAAKRSSSETKDEPGKLIIVAVKCLISHRTVTELSAKEQSEARPSTCQLQGTWTSLNRKCAGGGKMKERFTEWDRKLQISQKHCLKPLELVICQRPMMQQKKKKTTICSQLLRKDQHAAHLKLSCLFKTQHI